MQHIVPEFVVSYRNKKQQDAVDENR